MPVTWEGPAIYRTAVDVDFLVGEPRSPLSGPGGLWLVFHGVSYEAQVFVNGAEVGVHRGIWDAFAFPVPDSGVLQIEVRVTKNGGPSFPVKDVASGFLPFVYHTFGGIYQTVELVRAEGDPTLVNKPERTRWVRAEGTSLFAPTSRTRNAAAEARSKATAWLESRGVTKQAPAPTEEQSEAGEHPFYARGVLMWGWYPLDGHTNPPDEVIQREIDQAKKLGFNLLKFCLWIPSHRYLELMELAGLWAWIELPLWDPTPDLDKQEAMASEMERIVSQYSHHPNVALWTCGCELHESTSARYRQRLYEVTKGAFVPPGPLVKDNSGSAEMYGGDLREFGDFYDFHPYCDTQFYPPVLDSLLVGPRREMPILLGEFNDIDVHRDLARLREDSPYWASTEPALNDQGVRWQQDLPEALRTNRFATDPQEHRLEALIATSLSKSRFMRKYVQESVRSRSDIAGYVVTGWRDTPISSSGMLDDWDQPRFTPEDLACWNGAGCLFLIPTRRPPWINGGNRPGWIDPFNWFTGRVFLRIGVHSDRDLEGALEWDVLHFSWEGGRRPQGRVAFGAAEPCAVQALDAREVGQIAWDADQPGGYLLRVRYAGQENSWPIWIVPPFEATALKEWALDDPDGRFAGLTGFEGVGKKVIGSRLGSGATSPVALTFLTNEGTAPMPFWRESAYEFSNAAFWDGLGYREKWERIFPMSPDRAFHLDAVRGAYPGLDWEVLLNRIDVRTSAEHPVLVVGKSKDQRVVVTTLRPFGGLGVSPMGVLRNPSGAEFLRKLLA